MNLSQWAHDFFFFAKFFQHKCFLKENDTMDFLWGHCAGVEFVFTEGIINGMPKLCKN